MGGVTGATLGIILSAFAAANFGGAYGIAIAIMLAAIVIALVLPLLIFVAHMYIDGDSDWQGCFWGGFGLGLTLVTLNIAGLLARLVQAIGVAMAVSVPSSSAMQCF